MPDPVAPVDNKDMIAASVRTVIPLIVGWLATKLGFDPANIDPTTVAAVTAMAYYMVVRFIEQYFPKVGYLLGIPKVPVYVDPPKEG